MESNRPNYSTSAERTYRDCQRKWWWSHVERWRPVETPDALSFGSAWHRIREGAAPTLADPFKAAHLSALDAGYRARWDAEPFDVVATEQRFEVELIPDMLLVGVVDKVVRHKSRLWIVEHKTSGNDISLDSDYWSKLGLDTQISTYLLGSRVLGYDVAGVIYDVARKSDLRPHKATPEESRKFKKDGSLYANQREHDETPGDYGQRILDAINADPVRHYQRRELARTERQLQEHWLTMQTYARQQAAIEGVVDAPQNPDACMRWGRCQFLACCISGMSPAEFPTELHQPHPLLSDPSLPF